MTFDVTEVPDIASRGVVQRRHPIAYMHQVGGYFTLALFENVAPDESDSTSASLEIVALAGSEREVAAPVIVVVVGCTSIISAKMKTNRF